MLLSLHVGLILIFSFTVLAFPHQFLYIFEIIGTKFKHLFELFERGIFFVGCHQAAREQLIGHFGPLLVFEYCLNGLD